MIKQQNGHNHRVLPQLFGSASSQRLQVEALPTLMLTQEPQKNQVAKTTRGDKQLWNIDGGTTISSHPPTDSINAPPPRLQIFVPVCRSTVISCLLALGFNHQTTMKWEHVAIQIALQGLQHWQRANALSFNLSIRSHPLVYRSWIVSVRALALSSCLLALGFDHHMKWKQIAI